jgi:hypothetical protein
MSGLQFIEPFELELSNLFEDFERPFCSSDLLGARGGLALLGLSPPARNSSRT